MASEPASDAPLQSTYPPPVPRASRTACTNPGVERAFRQPDSVPMNFGNGTLLGPQCLSCKRRRVKCDSTTPHCKRCRKDELECPGYTKSLQIAQFQPDARLRKSANRKSKSKSATPPDIFSHLSLSVTSHDKEMLVLLDSVQCMNEQIIPDIMPLHAPFRRQKVPKDFWQFVPEVVRNLMIVTVQAIQVAKMGIDPLTNRNLCHHRGLGLLQLKSLILTGESDQYELTLTCILMVLMADMQLSGPSWTSHCEGARKIILLRGGFEKCFQELQDARGLLIGYMCIDIFTATTRDVSFLEPEIAEAQTQYIPIVHRHYMEIIKGAYTCPAPLLEAIVHINILRIQANQPSDGAQFCTTDVNTILESIEAFDVHSWARNVSNYGEVHPQRLEDRASIALVSAWIGLASCYKSATILYLILSSNSDLKRWSLTVRAAKYDLSRHIYRLFELAAFDRDGPVESQLWKFTVWPLLISAYVGAGWDIGAETVISDLRRLRMTGMFVGLRPVLSAERVVHMAQAKRIDCPDMDWKWDDGFDARSAFVL